MKTKKLVTLAGRLLMAAAAGFIAVKLWNYRADLLPLLTPGALGVAGLCTLSYGAIVYALSAIYRTLLHMTTGRLFPWPRIGLVYCKSNIYKYLPGNVMQYVGRNQLAVEEDLSHLSVATATLLEIGVTVLSTVVLVACFSMEYAITWVTTHGVSMKLIWLALAAMVVLVLLALIFFRKKFVETLRSYRSLLTARNALTYAGLILFNVVTTILNGLLFLWVLSGMGASIAAAWWLPAIGLYALSFLLGYITPGVPGGIGIREAVLTAFFSGMVDSSTILAGALLFRIVSVLGDVAAYVLAEIVSRMTTKG